ncbi:hypothetical protein L5L78_15860 [Shewanella sp. SM34]|uniref:hypothetical protein n=1 Tax=unclassified Shewanella TaxID=196818 RepID=UPI0021DA91C4|nr:MULTISPECIES: hypothetical protein [unclassified Shewanella]MCU8057748.1 hypothetical protein [Shewanella sp. SM35]MCU8066578.1 hypothetical protein [Shewanella sp. SM34]
MSQRIECSRRTCRWTGIESELSEVLDPKYAAKSLTVYNRVCPKCGCDSYYQLPEPKTNKRVKNANELIKVISEHGRKFFEHKGVIATLELDKRGRVWLVDEYTKARVYTHYSGKWSGFHHGGTLRDLVCAMRDYITNGTLIPLDWIAPTRRNPDNGDIWGYGKEAASAVRAAAAQLPIIKQGEQA